MKLRWFALLISLFYVAWAWAAENQVEQVDENIESAETSVTEEAGAEDGSTATDMDEEGAPEDEDSPGRFIPTEQISQDLGVSFPVDI